MSDEYVTVPDDEPGRPGEEPAPGNPEDPRADEPVVAPCAECGNPLEEGQPYCLECGAPTPAAPRLGRRIGPAGILAIGLVALAIGAGALAYAIAKEDSTAQVTTIATIGTSTGLPPFGTTTFPTSPPVDVTTGGTFPTTTFPTTTLPTTTSPPTTTFPTTTTPTTTTGPTATSPTTTTLPTTTTPTTTPTATTTTPATGADTWPDGTAGWTVILASTRSQADATAFRNRVQATGRSAGLIDSSRYETLEAGYWVVYSGVYTSRTRAISQARALRSTYPGAYAQRVVEA